MFRATSMITTLAILAIEMFKNKNFYRKMFRYFPLLLLITSFVFSQSPHGEIKIDCSNCHTTSEWIPIKEKIDFDHSTTGFPLLDSHAGLNCIDCHKKEKDGSLIFSKVESRCSACHFDFHNGNLGDKCQSCHSFKTWKLYDVVRKHNKSRFPLLGAHASVKCESCHLKNGIFQTYLIPLECISCHEKNYIEAKKPNHISLNFSKNCNDCHTIKTVSWHGERAFHNKTGFPLTGAHAIISCDKCHQNWEFNLTLPADCYSCHKTQYEQTTNPNHQLAGFPTNCSVCHNTSSWRPATNFDHDKNFFRIYSGEHRNKWRSCNDCHINPADYKNFSCITYCHSQASTDRKHRNVSGYRYESSACYSCHRNV
ncbi:Cytochrome c7 [Candidatus Chrysopegis kryptomonas]|uniref:Cytochrome c7 n=2 Tax=Candidatus Chryseopegocella kryptomonas TaxID=1633643 RepID=A0A0P1MSY4_9BACT|nr:Cytochrome c7 [Candidatus Chrysopegis kryptomonas]